MLEGQRANVAKKRFVVRQVLVFGGLSSLLGILSVYHRHFGWQRRETTVGWITRNFDTPAGAELSS